MRRGRFLTALVFFSFSVLNFYPCRAGAADMPAAGATAGVSLHQVLGEAYLKNPDLEAARAELKITDENYFQAQAGFKPSLSGAASYQSNHSVRDTSTAKSDPKKI